MTALMSQRAYQICVDRERGLYEFSKQMIRS